MRVDGHVFPELQFGKPPPPERASAKISPSPHGTQSSMRAAGTQHMRTRMGNDKWQHPMLNAYSYVQPLTSQCRRQLPTDVAFITTRQHHASFSVRRWRLAPAVCFVADTSVEVYFQTKKASFTHSPSSLPLSRHWHRQCIA